jgi:hypothetical protein
VGLDPDDVLAQQVADKGWGRREELSPPHLGLNRLTWKVGDLWLTGIDEDRAALLERENRLLHELRSAASMVQLDVPEVVPTVDGGDVIRHGARAFRATAHIPGARPDGNLAETYRGSMLALRSVHLVLRDMPPDLAVLPPMLTEVGELLNHCLTENWAPVTTDASEAALVRAVAEWLAPRLAHLEDAPQQLIHGDWSTPNLLVDDTSTGHVVAVLDWQLCSIGPVIGDIAQAVSGALMFANVEVEPVVDSIFATYGAGVDRRLLGPAMVAYWFRNYWWSRAELRRDERLRTAMERQPERLRSVLQYAESLGA